MDADGFVVSFPPPRVRTAVNTEGAEGGADTAVHDDDDAAAMVFFRRYGFVVYRDVLSKDECEATRAEIWNHLERVQFPPTPGASRCLSRHDRTTWDLMDNVDTYGLAPDPAVFTRQLVRNRQNPRVLACLAAVLRRETIYDSPTASTSEHSCVPSELTPACVREVIVSQDRWCVYRPTVNVPVGVGDATTDKPEWRTRPNVHLDLSGIPPKRLPEVLPRIEMVGDKVLWGTDWPSPGVKDLKQNILDFLALPQFSDEFKHKVLVDNPNRLFPPR